MLKRILLSTFIAVLFCLVRPAVFGQSALPGLDVSGIAQGPDGAYFATVRGIGLVQAGDVISFNTDQETGKFRIVDIGKSGVKAEKFDVVHKEIERPPVPKTKPKVHYEFRDPFWPAGYDPNAT